MKKGKKRWGRVGKGGERVGKDGKRVGKVGESGKRWEKGKKR